MKVEKNFIFKIILVVIFTASFLLMIFSGLSDSQTTDEAIHLFSGYTYLTQNDFRLDPEHPPLLKELSALPLLFFQNLNISLGDLWLKSGNFYYDSWQEARVLGEQFFYLLGNNPAKLLFWGRLPFIFLTLILGYAGYFWAKKLYGVKAGILSAFLILFFPNFLAHGHLINTDLGLTLFIFIATYFWGKFLKQKNWQNLLLTGLFSGLAMASKYTAIILFIILFILAVVKLFQEKKEYGKIILGYVGVLIISLMVIWATYGFSLNFLANYYKGISFVLQHALGGHGSFLLGQNSNVGWWYYFPITILFKTPIPIFILLILTIIYFKKIHSKDLFDEYLLIIPPIIYLVFAMISKADLGIRHILPIFPFLFVFIAKSTNILEFTKLIWLKIIIVISIVWYLISALVSFPNYLAYFNEFVSGPKGGYKILADSNLDWGQDIYRLKDYLTNHNIDKIYLVYPWDGDSALNYSGINFEPLTPAMQNVKGPVVVSATYFQTDVYKWLKKYPFEQITPGLFIFNLP